MNLRTWRQFANDNDCMMLTAILSCVVIVAVVLNWKEAEAGVRAGQKNLIPQPTAPHTYVGTSETGSYSEALERAIDTYYRVKAENKRGTVSFQVTDIVVTRDANGDNVLSVFVHGYPTQPLERDPVVSEVPPDPPPEPPAAQKVDPPRVQL